jgi:hypothetical protein
VGSSSIISCSAGEVAAVSAVGWAAERPANITANPMKIRKTTRADKNPGRLKDGWGGVGELSGFLVLLTQFSFQL